MMIVRDNNNQNIANPRNYSEGPGEPSLKDVERGLRDAGFSRKVAKTLLSVGFDASAALYGWEVDPRDVGDTRQPQAVQQRDAVASAPCDPVVDILSRLSKFQQ